MKKRSVFYSSVVGIVAGGLALQFGVGGIDAYAQKVAGGPLVTKTAKVSAVKPLETKAVSPAMARAAAVNSNLKNSLRWTFGGKTQLGWNIYSSLIAETLNTDAGPDSPEFADALSVWQSQNALAATGTLDSETLGAFIKFWQSQRLGRSNNAGNDSLFLAPAVEFWDNSRDEQLRKLEGETYAAYKTMLAAAAKDLKNDLKLTKNGDLAPDEKFLRIVSAYRSPEYQAQLRKNEPNAGRAALAKHSPHFTGRALDIYVGGEPVTTKDANRAIQVQTPAYKWLVKNARKFGFYPYFYEPWHWEYVGQPKPQR